MDKAKRDSLLEMSRGAIIERVDEEGRIGLFEADGGVWKLEAKRNVKEYLDSALSGLVEAGKAVVMM